MKKTKLYRMVRGATRLYYQHMETDQCPPTIDLILWMGIFADVSIEISMNNSSDLRRISHKLVSWLSILPLHVITHAKGNCYMSQYREQLIANRYYREKPKKRIVNKKIVRYVEED